MRKILYLFVVSAVLAACVPVQQETGQVKGIIPAPAVAPVVTTKPGETSPDVKPESALKIANFDSGSAPNLLGGGFGAWDKDPNDDTQTCVESFESRGDGYCLKLTYDVDSPNPAYNGFWMKLENLNASGYKTFVFSVRGDAKAGFTKRFKIELKNSRGEVGKVYVSGITGDWQQKAVPLGSFIGLTDLKESTEWVVVFEDAVSDPKTGAIYIDDIWLSK